MVLTLIPFWFRAFDAWSVKAVLSQLCVVAAIALTAVMMFGAARRGAARWARVAICGLVGGAVHLATLTVFHDIVSLGWAVVVAVGTGSIVIAVIGGMLAGVGLPARPRTSPS